MSQSTDPLLRAEKLTKVYRSGDEEIVVLDELDLDVCKGELVALVGESGTGKTTLLHLLAALDTPTGGAVYFMGQRLSEFGHEERAAYRNLRVGFMWQMHYLLPEFSALENVVIPQLIGGDGFSQASERARELLGEVGLANAAARRVGELSGGEQQRVALARALANQPALLLADEPTGSLDSLTAGHVFQVFERLLERGKTIIMVTHDNSLAPRFTRHIVIQDGEIIPEKRRRA